jgi:hypothetical protein
MRTVVWDDAGARRNHLGKELMTSSGKNGKNHIIITKKAEFVDLTHSNWEKLLRSI